MIKVEFEFSNMQEYLGFCALLTGSGMAAAPAKVKQLKEAKPEETKAEVKEEKPVEAKNETSTSVALDADAVEKRRVTLRQLNSEKTTAGFKTEVKTIYSKYGATNVSTADPVHFDAIEADLKALGA